MFSGFITCVQGKVIAGQYVTFLWSLLQVESSDTQDNGTCSVMRAKGMTFTFYNKANTLQLQGKENANQLRAALVKLN